MSPNSDMKRRVSFSDRIFYSDDASTSTVSTDDECFQDDGSVSSSDEEDDYCSLEGVDSDDETADDSGDDEFFTGHDEDDPFVEDDNKTLDPDEGQELGGSDEEAPELESTDEDEDEEEEEEEEDLEEELGGAGADEGSSVAGSIEDGEEDDMNDDSKNEEFSLDSYLPVKDEPPLTFRDRGVTQRPDEFLGGYGYETACGPTHTVKLRKSWMANAKEEEQEQSDYQEFEAWKKARAKAAAEKKARAQEAKEEAVKKEEAQNEEEEQTLVADTKPSPTRTKPGRTYSNREGGECLGTHKPVSALKSKPQEEMKLEETEPTSPSKKPKSALKKKKTKADATQKQTKRESQINLPVEEEISEKQAKRESKSGKKVKATKPATTRKITKLAPRDPETEAHEKEVLELKEHIAKLQMKLDTTEVRIISQLADLEEETTKRMRDYRAKADEIVRKQKAKNEKQALKQKAMKSQDVINQLRKSNHKMRAGGIKVQAAIDKLKESNQTLEEKNSVHRGYASEFLEFQKVEVGLAEAMNKALTKDIPKYEKLIRSMEDGVTDRFNSGHIERNAKDLYEDCIQSMVDMLEEGCNDRTLLDKVESLLNDEDSDQEDTTTREPPFSSRGIRKSLNGKKGTSVDDRKADTPSGSILKKKKSSIKRTSKVKASPTKSPVRRSSSGLSKLAGEEDSTTDTPPKKRSSSRDSFRSTRTPRKSSLLKPVVVSDTDDSSICSMTSATSGNFSITDYAY